MKTEDKRSWIVSSPENAISIITLPHPKTQKRVKFVVTKDSKLFELTQHTDGLSSWFLDNQVKSDGTMFVASPFDPLYIALPLLKSSSPGKFVLLEQVQTGLDPLFTECIKDGSQLRHICETTETNDFKAFRYDEEKALNWLKKKVERLMKKVNEANLFIHDTEASKEESNDSALLLRYSFELLSEYLEDSVAKKLKAFLQIPDKVEKRKSTGTNPVAKKVKTENEAIEDYSQIPLKNCSENKPKLTRKQKILSKVDKKGMKSLDTFFKPKN